MIAAIYARKSTEQNGIADEEKSVTRQIDHAKAYAAKKGWTVADIYSDDGISGAEFVKRPGFLRLMNALKPRPTFQVLIMSEESRLGREQIETAYALKQILMAGVEIWCYLDDKQITLSGPHDKILLAVTSAIADMEREKARQRTADAMLRKARAGHVTGGRVFGYDNRDVYFTEVAAEGRRTRLHVERVVNSQEAAIVRRIFEMCSEGLGYKKIADALNREGVLAPQPRGTGRLRAWAASTIREILHRPLYRGEIVWNQRRKRDQWGQKRYQKRQDHEIVRLPLRDDLRVVPDSLWHAVHERLDNAKAIYLRSTDGQLWGRPANGLESKYMLTGLLRCGACGGTMTVTSSDWKSRRKFAYACSHNRFRGSSVCANNLWAPMAATDSAVLESLKQEILHPAVVERALRQAFARLQSDDGGVENRRAKLLAERQRLQVELGRLTAAIVAGEAPAQIVDAIRERERRQRDVDTELTSLESLARVDARDLASLPAELSERLSEWKGLLTRHPAQARQIARKLVEGRLTLTPLQDGMGRFYEVKGQGTLGRVLAGTFLAKAMVTPAGFEPAISTLKGLRPRPG